MADGRTSRAGSTDVSPSRAANRWNVRTDTTTRAALEAPSAGTSPAA